MIGSLSEAISSVSSVDGMNYELGSFYSPA